MYTLVSSLNTKRNSYLKLFPTIYFISLQRVELIVMPICNIPRWTVEPLLQSALYSPMRHLIHDDGVPRYCSGGRLLWQRTRCPTPTPRSV